MQQLDVVPVKMAPNSIEAEEAVIGSVLIDTSVLYSLTFLEPIDFFIVRHQWIFEALRRIQSRGEAIDYLTVIEELRHQGRIDEIGGEAYITYLINNTPSTIYAETYGHIVERAAIRRRLVAAASQNAQLALNEDLDINAVLDTSEANLAAVTVRRGRTQLENARSVASALYDTVERARELHDKGEATGIPSGLADLDGLLGGFFDALLYIAAGRPGMGKTSWQLTVARHVLKNGLGRVGIFSQEMAEQQLVRRLASMETGIPVHKLRTGALTDAEWAEFTATIGEIGTWPLWIDDTPNLTPEQMRGKAKRWQNEHGITLIMQDYLQLMISKKGENRTQQVSDISRTLKLIARELDVPVIAAAQLSREVERREDKRPFLSDLRDSGSIEQDADVVMFLYRDEYYNEDTERPNQIDVMVSKHRDGPTGTATLYFRKELTELGNLRRTDVNLKGY